MSRVVLVVLADISMLLTGIIRESDVVCLSMGQGNECEMRMRMESWRLVRTMALRYKLTVPRCRGYDLSTGAQYRDLKCRNLVVLQDENGMNLVVLVAREI